MIRKRKTKDPCVECGLHLERCICREILRLDLQTQIVLMVHAKELKRTTNTGRLALKALTNAHLVVRGESTERVDVSALLGGGYQDLLLYPSDDADDLNDFKRDGRPVRLFVPDGNWRQAAKVAIRHPELATVPRVKLSTPFDPYAPRLRREPKEGGMATLEAIAHALAILEGQTVAEQILGIYQAKLKATLIGRGKKIDI